MTMATDKNDTAQERLVAMLLPLVVEIFCIVKAANVRCTLHHIAIKHGSSLNLCIYSLNINFRSIWTKQNNFATKET